MKRSYKTTLLTVLLLLIIGFSHIKAQDNLQWFTIDQVEQMAQKTHKKVLIEVYTKWSDGFKQLERSTLSQPQIVNYLNDKFLTIKFDAETRSDINFRNKTYHFISQSGVSFNELASELLQGQMVYPTLVFLDERMNLIQTIQYRSSEQFEMIITYFGDDNHKKVPWNKYEKNYIPLKK